MSRAHPFLKYPWGPLGWRCCAQGCVPWVGAGDLSVLQGDDVKTCPEPPSLPGELSGTPLPCVTISFRLFACVFPLVLFFHGAKTCPELPHRCLASPQISHPVPCHPWGWHPHCHPVLAALRAPSVRPGLSCGTEINIKSWQSNEPKIQGQNKLLIARPARTRYGTSGGLCNTLKPSRSGQGRGTPS